MNLDSIKKMSLWKMPSTRRHLWAEVEAEEVEAEASKAKDTLIQRIKMHMRRLAMKNRTFKVIGGEVRNGLIIPIANATIAGSMATMLETAVRS